MFRRVLLVVLLSSSLAFAQEKAKPESPADVSLSRDQEHQLELIASQFREAVALEEAAKAKKESAQLKYVLAVTQFRVSLKVSDEYQFDEAAKKFLRKQATKP